MEADQSQIQRLNPQGRSSLAQPLLARRASIWQRRFWEHLIRDDDDLERHVNYIHYNPEKQGYVARPVDWPYSSIHDFIRRGQLDANWGTSQPILLPQREIE